MDQNEDYEMIYSQNTLQTLKSEYELKLKTLIDENDQLKKEKLQQEVINDDLKIQIEKNRKMFEDRLKAKGNQDQSKQEKELESILNELLKTQDINKDLQKEIIKFEGMVGSLKKDVEKQVELVKKLNSENLALKNQLNKNPKPKIENNNFVDQIKSNLIELNIQIKNNIQELESRIEVIKFLEVEKTGEWIKKLYLEDLNDQMQRFKGIQFFKDIASSAFN